MPLVAKITIDETEYDKVIRSKSKKDTSRVVHDERAYIKFLEYESLVHSRTVKRIAEESIKKEEPLEEFHTRSLSSRVLRRLP